MISVSGLSLQFSSVEIFSNISFNINPKDRIGLIGKNGAGKTSLLNIIAGIQKQESGKVVIPEGQTIGYLPQELKIDSSKTIYETAITAFKEIDEIEDELKEIQNEIAIRKDYQSKSYEKLLNNLNSKLERVNYFDANKRKGNVEKILKGLGFVENDFDRKMSEFSGGWQMRVELSKILLRKPELLLLDEPTNHLDIESIIWIENFLINYGGAVMLVSHDRMFLDNVCNRTIEIINGKIYDYKLTFTKFLIARQERLDSQIATAQNQEQFIKQQERFIERFRAKNTKAKQVKSKIKQLEKIDRVELDESNNSEINIKFPTAPRSGKVVVEAINASKSYGDKTILQNLEFHISIGERIAFVGKNGEGKTTLIKMINGEIDFDNHLQTGYNVEVGYYAQVQENTLDESITVLDTIQNQATGDWSNIAKTRGLLGAFLFTENDIDKKVKVLSGGEKSRLAIAKLLLKPINLLILDEPTNHLDISSKNILKQALLQYNGTLIIVSHDRDFLQNLTEKTFEFTDKGIKEHIGPINEFLDKHKVETFRDFEAGDIFNKKNFNSKKDKSNKSNKQRYLEDKNQEKKLRKLKNSIKNLEKKIEKIENEIKEIEKKMQSSDFYDNIEKANKTTTHYDSLKNQLEQTMNNWGELSDKLD
ncbi:MAG: ABC-F family ATP-binding cassette domain-containing protein [Bacteroidota bacterium]|nr:ABC-F family ATP-binding cassette domain-containing protein [Bacteroidota bacterium]